MTELSVELTDISDLKANKCATLTLFMAKIWPISKAKRGPVFSLPPVHAK